MRETYLLDHSGFDPFEDAEKMPPDLFYKIVGGSSPLVMLQLEQYLPPKIFYCTDTPYFRLLYITPDHPRFNDEGLIRFTDKLKAVKLPIINRSSFVLGGVLLYPEFRPVNRGKHPEYDRYLEPYYDMAIPYGINPEQYELPVIGLSYPGYHKVSLDEVKQLDYTYYVLYRAHEEGHLLHTSMELRTNKSLHNRKVVSEWLVNKLQEKQSYNILHPLPYHKNLAASPLTTREIQEFWGAIVEFTVLLQIGLEKELLQTQGLMKVARINVTTREEYTRPRLIALSLLLDLGPKLYIDRYGKYLKRIIEEFIALPLEGKVANMPPFDTAILHKEPLIFSEKPYQIPAAAG